MVIFSVAIQGHTCTKRFRLALGIYICHDDGGRETRGMHSSVKKKKLCFIFHSSKKFYLVFKLCF